MAGIDEIAKQFTDYYYQTFDTTRELRPLYRDSSMLSWEGVPMQGAPAIEEKLKNLPFQKVQHKVTTIDAQPSNPTIASLIVTVTGLLAVDDGANALQFTQVFHLIPEMVDGQQQYYVLNDIFRLNYG